jgi:hypothetical protein
MHPIKREGGFIMATKLKMMLFALVFIGLIGGTLVVTSGEAKAESAQYQAENMFEFGDPDALVAGGATLTRTPASLLRRRVLQSGSIAFRIYTSELQPGAHTVWIVIFNKPENCAAGPGACAIGDLNTPEVQGSVVYGSGYIVGPDGIANFHGSLKEGSPPDGIQVNVPLGTVNGLKSSMKAEIHLVVREHGFVDDMGEAVDQLTTFQPVPCGGACNVQAVVFDAVAPDGADQ